MLGSTLDIPVPVTSQPVGTDSKLTVKKSVDVNDVIDNPKGHKKFISEP